MLMMLNTRNRLLGEKRLFVGTVNASLISAREIFLEALRYQAVYIILVHNHPSGGAFSDSDLLSTAQDRSSGIVATGKNGSYIFRKGKNFNASGFARAVKNATMMGTGYDDAADKWLKANQSKYGYSYEFQKK